MAMLHMDGFDSYANTSDLSFEYVNSGTVLTLTGGRFGGGAFQIASTSGQILSRPMPGSLVEVWVGVAIYSTYTANNPGVICEFKSAAGIEASFLYNGSTGLLQATTGEENSVLGSATITGISNSWHFYEFHYKYDGSAGIMELWIDGEQLINVTGVNTTRNAGQTIVTTSFGSLGFNCMSGYYDDIYILSLTDGGNITRLGDSRIVTLLPSSDAGPNDGTPSTGTDHFACVDETHWSTSTFLTMTNTSGQEELFGMSDLGSSPANVWAVKVLTYAEKSDAGAASLEMVVKSSSTSAVAGSTALSTTYQSYEGIFEIDPNTSAQWTGAAIDAMKCGVQVP